MSTILNTKTKFSESSDLLLSVLKEAQDERKTGKQLIFKKPKDAMTFVDKIIVKKK
ncbi:MAG: hypothetical protein WCT11_03430 [Candidatus Magasanikbacteria bacterium]